MTKYRAFSNQLWNCQRINTGRLLLLWWRKYLRVILLNNDADCFKGKKEHHILALSGGKDSAALAVYMRNKYRI